MALGGIDNGLTALVKMGVGAVAGGIGEFVNVLAGTLQEGPKGKGEGANQKGQNKGQQDGVTINLNGESSSDECAGGQTALNFANNFN